MSMVVIRNRNRVNTAGKRTQQQQLSMVAMLVRLIMAAAAHRDRVSARVIRD